MPLLLVTFSSAWLFVTAAAVAAYLLLYVCLWRFQARCIFFPTNTIERSPADLGVRCQQLRIPLNESDGRPQTLDAWWLPAHRENAPAVLYLHGNGDNISISTYADQAVRLRNLGLSVLLFDYRGFGRSDGAFPSEESVYQDAESAWRYLVEQLRMNSEPAFIYGHSLGGAIAIELAQRHPEAAGLIVESSFTSIREMARYFTIFRIFPLRHRLRHHFDSISKVPTLKVPVLFLHGTRDLTVPCRMSHELHAAAPEPKQLLIIRGGHHLDNAVIGGAVYLDTLRGFIDRSGPLAMVAQMPNCQSPTC